MLVLNHGIAVVRHNRKGGRVIVKSKAQAYAKLGLEDWMADDWEIWEGKGEPLGPNWLPF